MSPPGFTRRRGWLFGALALASGVGVVAATRQALRAAGQRPGATSSAHDHGPGDICLDAPPFAWQGPAAGDRHGPRPVPAGARCPVCGMFAARHPRWASLAVFDDGAAQFLDSPLHLLLYLQRVPRYSPGRQAEDLRALFVADHGASGPEPRWLPLDEAWLVLGSSQPGPMRGEDLPAFGSAQAAGAFALARGGQPVRAAGLRASLPASLQALAPHGH